MAKSSKQHQLTRDEEYTGFNFFPIKIMRLKFSQPSVSKHRDKIHNIYALITHPEQTGKPSIKPRQDTKLVLYM